MASDNILFAEIERHLLFDETPSRFLSGFSSSSALKEYPFNMLELLQSTPQSPQHHPEGSVWNHTLLVVDQAAKVREQSVDARTFMWAALLHDLGKPSTTMRRKSKITSYDHDKVGAQLTKEFLSVFTADTEFIDRVARLVRYHMQILFVVKDLPFADVEAMMRDVDIREVALLGLCDRLGRKGSDRRQEEENIRTFLKRCSLQSGGQPHGAKSEQQHRQYGMRHEMKDEANAAKNSRL